MAFAAGFARGFQRSRERGQDRRADREEAIRKEQAQKDLFTFQLKSQVASAQAVSTKKIALEIAGFNKWYDGSGRDPANKAQTVQNIRLQGGLGKFLEEERIGAQLKVTNGQAADRIAIQQETLEIKRGAGDKKFNDEVRRLTDGGVPPARAKGLASGQIIKSRNPITGQFELVDVATNTAIPALPAGSVQPQAGPAAQDQAAPGAPSAPTSTGIAADESFGISGALKGIANAITDIAGAGTIFEKELATSSLLNILRLETIQVVSAGAEGKPNAEFQKDVKEAFPTAGSFFTGRETALSKLSAFQTKIKLEQASLQSQVDGGTLRPVTEDKMSQRIARLDALNQQFELVISSFKPKVLAPIESFQR